MGVIGLYKNGNYKVMLMSDGTKIRKTNDNEFIPSFAENCDCKITNQCDMGCIYCHENSKIDGKHGDILNAKFIDTLHPYTELAIGGGNALAHPDLIPFLHKLKVRKVIANMTVNQYHFENNIEFIEKLIDDKLIYGLGISICDVYTELIAKIHKFPNAVIHVINGIIKPKDIELLSNNNLKMLVLGYKQFRRGKEWYNVNGSNIVEHQTWLYENLENIISKFDVVSFDNLGIEQLNPKRLMTDKEWQEFYMGDDGTMTFYIDLVENKFAQSSIGTERYDLLDDIDDMFNVIVNME